MPKISASKKNVPRLAPFDTSKRRSRASIRFNAHSQATALQTTTKPRTGSNQSQVSNTARASRTSSTNEFSSVFLSSAAKKLQKWQFFWHLKHKNQQKEHVGTVNQKNPRYNRARFSH
jgi:hypothetical protein